jgi:cytochrome P450
MSTKKFLPSVLQEMKALLCTLVAHFEILQAQDMPKETSAITMKPDGGLLVKLRRLDPSDSITNN